MRAIGYCQKCKKPFKWHQNELDFSATRGVQVLDRCVFLDGSRPGFHWGMATRKPAREYETGARITNEICAYQNPERPGYPCLKPRGHEEDSEHGVHHDHGLVPYTPPKRSMFDGFKEQSGVLRPE